VTISVRDDDVFTIAHLTLVEARRRRIVTAAVVCGTVFLTVFGTGLFFIARSADQAHSTFLQRQVTLSLLTVAGAYATNFLTALFALLLPVDALSGEIDSGIVQTIASKPIRRGDVVIGKWLGFGVVIVIYAICMLGGVFLVARATSGYVPPNIGRAMLLTVLEVMLLLTVSIAGGTRLSTVTNGVVAVGFFGVGFIGGWIEQIGTLGGFLAARNIGIAVSLLSPADALWRLSSSFLQPRVVRDIGGPSPFASASVPSALMVWWAIGMTAVILVWGIRQFSRRPL
jgi:Cu-processing system permease protein